MAVANSHSPLFSLIMPAYNPGRQLGTTFAKLHAFLTTAGRDWEVLLVNDGSTDGSPEDMDDFANSHPQVRALHLPSNQGKGKAVRVGMLAATSHFRIFTDIDMAYDCDQILNVARQLESGKPIVIASRSHPQSELHAPAHLTAYMLKRRCQSYVFSRLVQSLLDLPQRDTQAGLKGMSAQAALDILPRLHCNGFAFDCEMLFACQQLGWPVHEIPVRVAWSSRASTIHWLSSLHMLKELWSIRRRRHEYQRIQTQQRQPLQLRFAPPNPSQKTVTAALEPDRVRSR